MPPEIELSSWSHIAGYAICEALEDAGIEYAHDFTGSSTVFIGIKPNDNMMSIRLAITPKEYGSADNIQLSINNNYNCLLYNFNFDMDLSNPNNDPTECCHAIIESIKYFNKAQDALFVLIQKNKSIIWYFEHNFNNEIDHWLMLTGDITDEMAVDYIVDSKEEMMQDCEHTLHQNICTGINGVELREFYDAIDLVYYDEIIDVLIKFLEYAPGTRKFVLNGEIE